MLASASRGRSAVEIEGLMVDLEAGEVGVVGVTAGKNRGSAILLAIFALRR
jgi:hypothetical protein